MKRIVACIALALPFIAAAMHVMAEPPQARRIHSGNTQSLIEPRWALPPSDWRPIGRPRKLNWCATPPKSSKPYANFTANSEFHLTTTKLNSSFFSIDY